jgi:hypothetical protein
MHDAKCKCTDSSEASAIPRFFWFLGTYACILFERLELCIVHFSLCIYLTSPYCTGAGRLERPIR